MKQIALRTYGEFQRDGGARLAAAMAYYTLFAIAPALLVAVAIAGAVLGEAAVSNLVNESLAKFLGPELTSALVDLAQSRSAAMSSRTAWVTAALLLFASALAVLQLQAAFNVMWNVGLKPGVPFLRIVRARVAQSLIAFVPAILLAAGAFASSVAVALESRPYLGRLVTSVETLGSPLIVLGSSFIAFAVMFRYLPDARVPWRTAIRSAAVTSVAWFVGTYLFGLYVAWAAVASVYGAAGSVFVLLIWLNYSVRIMLVGCKVSKVLAEETGRGVEPREYAVNVRYEPVEEPRGSAHQGVRK